MGLSAIQEQRDVIIEEIKHLTSGDWKCLVVDSNSKKIIDNAVKEDDILNNNIAVIEQIEERREPNPEMDAIYLLSPEPHIVDCLLADFEARRYRSAHLVWTSLIKAELRRKIDDFPGIRQLRASTKTLFVDFYPRESHLITFRDPWSFPTLYHRECDSLVAAHLKILAQKIAGICITLGEYPKVRYYKPRDPYWDAAVLCSHLANFVQQELDMYAQWNQNFPPASNRPQATLVVTDRAMDLMAPLVHEFTYQAMAHDLLPIKEADKVTYHTVINAGSQDAEEKDMELSDKDKIWVDSRHYHMKDTIDKLMGDFRKFIEQNPHFANDSDADPTSLNTIRDMLAGLPQFQELKDAYSLHLTMAQECMNLFQARKLPDVASSEQTMATGLDEDYRKPKNVLDSVVRLLDDEAITPQDRLRLIIIFTLYRDGMILEDIKRLLAHASLPQQDADVLASLETLGGRTLRKDVKDVKQPHAALFPKDPKAPQVDDEYSLSRYETVVKSMLENVAKGTLDQNDFPYVKPPMDPNEDLLLAQGSSLRAGRPNWAAAGRRGPPEKNRQRIIVFMAGGATFSESRACYEVSNKHSRDVILATSHMLTPQLFVRQVGDLCRGRRQLDLPVDRPKPRAPAHLFERPAPPQPAPGPGPSQGPGGGRAPGPGMRPPPPHPSQGRPSPQQLPPQPGPGRPPAPPTAGMHNMSLKDVGNKPSADMHQVDNSKLHKEKKRRNFLGMKK